MKSALTLLSLLLSMTSCLFSEEKPWILDLTQTKLNFPEKRWSGAGSWVTTGGGPKIPLFEVKLIRLDKENYRIGDPYFLEVSLTNKTDIPQIFPCLPGVEPSKTERVLPAPPGYRAFTLNLEVRMNSVYSYFKDRTFLYGSEEEPGSTRLLQPGETVIIRQAGKWNPPPNACLANDDGSHAKIRVFARFSARYLKPPLINTRVSPLDSNEVLVGCKP